MNGRLARFSGLILAVVAGALLLWLSLDEWDDLPFGQPVDWQFNLIRPASILQEQIYAFHNWLLIICVVITGFVMALMVYVMVRFSARNNPVPSRTTHNTLIEVVWTVLPVLILIGIAIPSFRLLYLGDRVVNPEMTLIVHGYQWNWAYEYPDQQVGEYASYLVPDDELQDGQVRLLSTTAPAILPVDTDIQILVTGSDVIHSWAMPSFGIKRDANPGRMNEAWVRIEKEGTYYGQCSQICGTGHAYMPIEVHAVSREAFDDWVVQQTEGDVDPANPPVLLTRNWDGTPLAPADEAAPPADAATGDAAPAPRPDPETTIETAAAAVPPAQP